MHSAELFLNIFSLSKEKSRQKRCDIRTEAAADVVSLVV